MRNACHLNCLFGALNEGFVGRGCSELPIEQLQIFDYIIWTVVLQQNYAPSMALGNAAGKQITEDRRMEDQ